MRKQKSIESYVDQRCRKLLEENGVKYHLQQDPINSQIEEALKNAPSKSGGNGGNRPDISFLLDDGYGRNIPVIYLYLVRPEHDPDGRWKF